MCVACMQDAHDDLTCDQYEERCANGAWTSEKLINAISRRIAELYDGLDNDAETRDLVTAHVAADLCQRLAEQGVDHFHFYTMNRAGLSLSTCRLLGIKAETLPS